MKVTDIIKTANGNLLRSKLRTVLTLMAITIGAFTLTLTLGIGEGAKDFINKQTKTFTVEDELIITAKNEGSSNPFSSISTVQEYKPNQGEFGVTYLRNGDKEKIETVDGIERLYAVYNLRPEYIEAKDGKKYQINLSTLYPGLKPALSAGELPEEGDKGAILLAKRFVTPLGFASIEDAVGKDVDITFKNVKGDLRKVTLKISGVLVDTVISNGASMISPELESDLYKFSIDNNSQLIDQYYAFYAVTRPQLSENEVNDIKKTLSDKGYSAQTVSDQIQSIQSFITILQTSLSVFAGIAIIAATFGIVNTLLMGVYERTREIGLMKALGMRSGGIFSIFAFEALSIGFWGGLIGVLLGIGAGNIISKVAKESFLRNFEGFNLMIFPPEKMIYIVLATMLIGFIAGTLPAIKAARLNPIDALRYE